MQNMLKKMKLHGSKSYKRIYFSVILLLLAVMLLFSLLFYIRFIQQQKKEIYQRAQESVGRIESWMNAQYQEMSRIVLEINGDGTFSYAPIASKAQRENLLKELIRYVRGNSFSMDLSYESMLDEETIYSSQGIFDKETFKKYIYDVTEDFDFQEYKARRNHRMFTTISADQLSVRLSPQKAMAYVFGLPLMSDNPKRLITFYVDKDTIDHIVTQFLPCEMLDVRFYEQDTLVYSLYHPSSLPDNGVVISCEGGLRNYRYEMIASPDVLFADYHATQTFFFFMLGILCIVIMLASWVVAAYNYQPLHQLVSKYAKTRNEGMDEYALLNELVEDAIKQKRDVQKNLFISNVVWGQYEALESLQEDAQEAGIEFEYSDFICCALDYTESEDANALSARIGEELDTPRTMAVCAKRDGDKRLTIIINHTGALENVELARRVFKALKHTRVGMGTNVKDVMCLSESYRHARHALHEARDLSISFIQYSEAEEEAASSAAPEKDERGSGRLSPNNALLETVLSCMQAHLSDTGMSLEFIAGSCGVSASYLVRYFKSRMDMTPMQYVDSLRMSIARTLLTTTTQSLRQIVEQCGYLDESNFARKFKKMEGITPMSYRKLNWKNDIADIQ